MTNASFQSDLSALIDGEVEATPARFLFKRLGQDPEARAYWSRQHWLKGVLRGSATVPIGDEFAQRVAAAIATEAVPRRSVWAAGLRWAGGAAVAASVALVALLTVRPVHLSDPVAVEPPKPALGQVAQVAVRPSDLQPAMVPGGAQTVAATSNPNPGAITVVADPRTEYYLVRHNQALATQGNVDFVSYVPLIAPASTTPSRAAAPRESR